MCHGKVALVTGAAGKGMGRSIALTLARDGASVIVNYRASADEASAIVKYIESKGGKAAAFQADICRKEQCQAMYDAAVEKFGQVDICIIGPGGGWHTEPLDKLDTAGALDDVNKEIVPLYNLMPLVLPGMYARKWGRLIGISLLLSLPTPSYAYDAAKVVTNVKRFMDEGCLMFTTASSAMMTASMEIANRAANLQIMHGLDLNLSVAGAHGYGGSPAVPEGFMKQDTGRGQMVGEGIHHHISLSKAGCPECLGKPLDA